MLKRLLGMVFAVAFFYAFSLSIILPASANSDGVVDKSVITEYATSTIDAIEKIRKKLETKESVRVIVGLKKGTQLPNGISSAQTIDRLQKDFYNDLSSVVNVSQEEIVNFETVPYVSVYVTKESFEHLLQNPNVSSIEEDIPVRMSMAESHEIIGTTTAWDLGFTGKGQTVAILDTGVDKNHTFLKGKVVEEACYSTQNTYYDVQSLCPNKVTESHATGSGLHCKDIALGCDHGTHVAGTVAGKEVSVNGKKLSGVAKEANLIAVQVFTKIYDYWDGYFIASYNTDQLKALEYIYTIKDKYNISSINMSLGGGRHYNYCTSDVRNTIFNKLTSAGIAVVVASGNDGYNNSISAPACIESAVTVGATTDGDLVTYFSNSANMVDLLAPGNTITSSVPGGGYKQWAGTSMATPHVAGAWAILKEMKPDATVSEILNFLKDTGAPVKDYDNNVIKPRLDLSEIGEFSKTITSIEAEPTSLVSSHGESSQLIITADYTDGTTENVTNLATYSSSNVSRVTVSNTGLVTIPVKATNGTEKITAKFGNKSVVIPVTVEPKITGLTINQNPIALQIGKTSLVKVLAKYTDSTSKDITNLANYEILDDKDNLVTDEFTFTNGYLKAVTATKGNYTINFIYNEKEISADLTVVPILEKIEANKASFVVTTASPSQLAITAYYNDNSNEDVTQAATYTSSNTKLVTVDETGKITVIDNTKTGSVRITVKYGTKTLSIPVTVEKVVTGVEIQEDSLSVEIGKTTRYTVTVSYEDGSTKNITTLASATIVDGDGNVVEGITTSRGTLQALKTATKGNYILKVIYGGQEDIVALKVVPVLTKLAADQPSLVVTTASPSQLAITAYYNDNSNEDVTQAATYTSSNTKLVTVDETGKITVIDNTKTGSVRITVKYGTKTLSIPVTVEKVVTGVEIQEDSLSVEIGKTTRYTVTVSYEDGSTKNITTLASATIVDGDGNVVEGITTSRGTLQALKTATKGNYILKVIYGGQEDIVALKVVPVLTKLAADQPSLVVTTASPSQLAITAYYNDNSNEDVTQAATYTSSNTKLVTVDETGKITVIDNTKTGSVRITVKYGTKTLSIPVTVEKVVTGVEIQEDSLSVEIGKTTRYTVTVSYEDGSTKNITTLASATIVDGEGNIVEGITTSRGTLQALKTATKGNYILKVSYGGKEATQIVNVIPVLTKIVADKTSYVITADEPAQPIITAFYNDGIDEEITEFATFKSSNPKLIEVDSNGTIKVVDATKSGSARITVKFGTKTININVTCKASS